MKKALLAISLAVMAGASLSGCYTPQGQNAAGGAVLGGATGALVGAAATGTGTGALVGGAIGAGTGALIGAAATPPGPYPGYYHHGRCAEWFYDDYGRRRCASYY